MCGFFTKELKAELYKCSSAEFPKEYFFVYTSLENYKSARPCVFRVSVNQDRVLFRVADYLCKDSPLRFHLVFTAETDGNGNRKFGPVTVVSDGTSKDTPYKARCDWCFSENDARPFGDFIVERKSEYTWEVHHSYDVSLRTTLYCCFDIQCDKVKGLSVKYTIPFKIKHHTRSEEDLGSHIEREVKGEPPKAVKALTETEFQGKAYIVFPQGKGNPTTFSGSAPVNALVNNIGVILICDNDVCVIFNYYNHYFKVVNYRGLTLRQIERIVREKIDTRMKQSNRKREIEQIISEIQGRSQTKVVNIKNEGNYYGPGSYGNGSYNERH